MCEITFDKMKNHLFHQANTRGEANHGWLKSYHTFSFASYYNPERMNFGALRVLNDDTVAGGMGFGTHPHENMEIISIPLEGDLAHKDSMNNMTIIRNGDIQVMSAGTGVSHSEYNHNKEASVKFLQIWVFPNKKNVKPRYDQISLNAAERKNKLQQILSPYPDDEGVWIHQDAWFHIGNFEQGKQANYTFKKVGNGVYAFVIIGSFIIDGQEMGLRDGLGISGTNSFEIISSENDAEILLMEIPLNLN